MKLSVAGGLLALNAHALELKRYSDPKSIYLLLTTPQEAFADPACLSSILDSVEHRARMAVGQVVTGVRLAKPKNAEEPTVRATIEYGSSKQNVFCDLAEETGLVSDPF